MNSRSPSSPSRRLVTAVCGVLFASALSAGTPPTTLQSAQEALAPGDIAKARPKDWVAFAAHAEILIDRLDPRQALSIVETALKAQQSSQPPELLRLAARARGLLNERAAVVESRGQSLERDSPLQVTWIAAATQRLRVATRDIAAAGNGIVVDAGKSVLTDASLFKGAKGKAWIRNGIGQVRAASVESVGESANLVRLKLEEPFPAMASTQVVAAEGARFCFVFAFGAPGSLDPAFPLVTPGMVMRADTGVGGLMQITATLGAGHNGAAVFDPRGRLLGMAIASGGRELGNKEDVRAMLGNGNFAFRVDRLPGADKAPPAAGPQPPMPSVEELYERLVPSVVQVIALK